VLPCEVLPSWRGARCYHQGEVLPSGRGVTIGQGVTIGARSKVLPSARGELTRNCFIEVKVPYV